MEPTIGVVIPAFNCGRFLPQTIASLRRQTWPNWELVVVDDGSTDDTPRLLQAIAQEDGRISWLSQTNSGVATARNVGLASLSTRSAYVMILDHDDVLADDALEGLFATLEGSPAAVASHGVAQMIDQAGSVIGAGERSIQNLKRKKMVAGKVEDCPAAEPTTRSVLIYDNCLCTPGQALIKRNQLPEKGPFVPAYAPLDDWEFYVRLSGKGCIAYYDRVVIYWRRHDGAQSKANAAGMQRAELAVREAFARSTDLASEELEIAQSRLTRLYATIHRRQSQAARRQAQEALVRFRVLDAIERGAAAVTEYGRYLKARV